MEKKIIDAKLMKNKDNEIIIRFEMVENSYELNLQSDNSEEIKNVFLQLANLIRYSPIEINFSVNPSIEEKSNGLFIETATEYIKQLNDELKEIEKDKDLKTIRKFLNE